MTSNVLKKQVARYTQITLGALIVCLGFNLFIIPAHLLTGGLSGVALIIYYLTGLPVGMQNIVYNLPILYLAYRVFGRLYAWDTIVGTVVLSLILDATHFMVSWNITQDGMLNAIFGGVMAGIGFGIGALSMVGIPLFGGFAAKVNFATASVFTDTKIVLTLAVLAISSVLNALYYIPAVINIWSIRREAALPEAGKAKKDLTATAAIILLACGVLFLGVCFTPVMDIIVRGLELM